VGTGLDAFEGPHVPIQKVGRTTGHTEAMAKDSLYTLTNIPKFDFVKAILVLDAYGDAFCKLLIKVSCFCHIHRKQSAYD
jgi:hypothetical protein